MASSGKRDDRKRNVSALTQARVTLREIDGLYDYRDAFAPVQLVLGELRVPEWRSRRDQAVLSRPESAPERKARRIQEADLFEQAPLPGGVYCKVAGRQGDRWWRTFDRARSRPIRAKWLYVFQAASTLGEGARLVQELRFDEDQAKAGTFRRVDLRSQAGKDGRSLGRHDETRLLVDLERIDGRGPARAYHFFHLAPYQLTWAAVERLRSDLPARAILLGDEFFTDVHEGDDPGSARPLLEVEARRGAPPGSKLSFVLHLHDALGEALRRADRYERELSSMEQDERRLEKDRTHQLAMRIHFFTLGPAGLREHVPALDAYLAEREHLAIRRLGWLEETAFDLVRWIGREEQRVPVAWVDPGSQRTSYAPAAGFEPIDLCFRKDPPPAERTMRFAPDRISYRPPERSGGGRAATPPPAPWTNAFTQATRDYRETDDAEEVSLVVAAVHARLEETVAGRGWLAQNLRAFSSDRDSAADGGIAFLFGSGAEVRGAAQGGNPDAPKPGFQPGKKAPKIVTKGAAIVLAAYAKYWAIEYRQEALKTFGNFIRARWGADAVEVLSHHEYEKVRAEEKARHKAVRKFRGKPDRLKAVELNPRWVDNVHLASDVAKFADFGMRVVSTWDLVASIARDPSDPWGYGDLGSALLSDYGDLTTYVKQLPKVPEIELYGRPGAAIALKPIAVVTGVYDIAKGLRDVARSEDDGQRVGNMIATVGSVTALAGALAATGVAFPVLAAVGLGLQLAGKWYVDNFDDPSLFLRYCRFGDPGWHAKVDDVLGMDEIDRPWYRGDLKRLAQDLEAQHRALTEIQYDFRPQVTVVPGDDRTDAGLELTVRYPSQLTSGLRWEVEASLQRTGAATPERRPLAPVEAEELDRKVKRIVLFPLAETAFVAPGTRTPASAGVVSGRVRMRPFGDEGPVVERRFEERASAILEVEPREIPNRI